MNNAPIDLGFDLDSILGKKRNTTNFRYLEEGTAVYKILPAFDPDNRSLSAEHNFHWAQLPDGKNIKVQCTYFTEKYCPFCNAHRELERQYKAAEATEPEGSEVLKRYAKAMQKVQKTKQFYYNAVTPENEIVVLQLSKTVSDQLNRKLAEAVQEKNQDPTLMTAGYWFRFTKSGKGRDSVTVDFHRTSKVVEGEEVEVLNRTALPATLIDTVATKVAKIHSRQAMYINEYTGVELSDYLKGTAPLKDKYKERQEARKNSIKSESPSPSASLEAKNALEMVSNLESDEREASEPAPSQQKEPTSAAPSSAADAFAAEAARLRALAGKK